MWHIQVPEPDVVLNLNIPLLSYISLTHFYWHAFIDFVDAHFLFGGGGGLQILLIFFKFYY